MVDAAMLSCCSGPDGIAHRGHGHSFVSPDSALVLEARQGSLTQWLHAVYAEFNPAKLSTVDAMLEQYRGREYELIQAVTRKYNIDEPADRTLVLSRSAAPRHRALVGTCAAQARPLALPPPTPESPRAPTPVDFPMPDSWSRLDGLHKAFPFKGYIERAERRGITAQQLKRVLLYAMKHCSSWYDLKTWQMLSMNQLNLYHLADWLVGPATLDRKCSFVELLSSEEQVPEWYVVHWSGLHLSDFVACLARHLEIRKMSADTPVWVHTFAKRNHVPQNEVAVELGETNFCPAMLVVRGVLLVLGSSAVMTFTRLWCAFEEFAAFRCLNRKEPMLLDIAVCINGHPDILSDGPAEVDYMHDGTLAGSNKVQRERRFPCKEVLPGLVLHVQRAFASDEVDQRRILNWFAKRDLDLEPLPEHERYNRINLELRSLFAVKLWQHAVIRQTVREWGLHSVLHADLWRKSLVLDLVGCRDLTDMDVAILASGLPRSLEELMLGFSGCSEVGDEGMKALAAKFPSTLRKLTLNLQGCRQIGDDGVAAMVVKFPESIHSIKLNFQECKHLTDAAALIMAAQLPKACEFLTLDYGSTQVSNSFFHSVEQLREWAAARKRGFLCAR